MVCRYGNKLAELAALREPHAPPMNTQIQLREQSAANHAQFASVNHGRPAQAVFTSRWRHKPAYGLLCSQCGICPLPRNRAGGGPQRGAGQSAKTGE